jgi:hypothetical protein
MKIKDVVDAFWCPVCRTVNPGRFNLSDRPTAEALEELIELHELEVHGLLPHWGKNWGYPEPTTGGAHYRNGFPSVERTRS